MALARLFSILFFFRLFRFFRGGFFRGRLRLGRALFKLEADFAALLQNEVGGEFFARALRNKIFNQRGFARFDEAFYLFACLLLHAQFFKSICLFYL